MNWTKEQQEGIKNEARLTLNECFKRQMTLDEMRFTMVEMLQQIHDITTQTLYMKIALSPDFALFHAHNFNKIIGLYNQVIALEHGIPPIHIKEIDSEIVDNLEDYAETPIDELFAQYEEFKGGLH